MKRLYLYHHEKSTEVLGPGKRFAIWVQGCLKNCTGCLAKDSHPVDSGGYWINVDDIFKEIKNVPGLRGVTISGGEPFLQAEALFELAQKIRELSLDIICFSGYTYKELLEDSNFNDGIKGLLANIDILIDGEFDETLNNGEWLRGSSNQVINHLTNAYKHHQQTMNNTKNRSLEFKFRNVGEIFIVGIPNLTFEDDWNMIMNKKRE